MNNRQARGVRRDTSLVSNDDLKTIIQGDDTQRLVEVAERVGDELVKQRLTTAQIRNIFGTVRKIEMNWPEHSDSVNEERVRNAQHQLLLLKPKLAYQAKRERGGGVQALESVLSPAIDLVGDDRAHFGRFVDFFEAILAYHRAAGGRDR